MSIVHRLPAVDAQDAQENVSTWRDGLPPDEPPVEHPFGKKWRRKRFLVWMRDDFRCVYCGMDLLRDYQTLHTATIDHVKPQSAGGTHDIDNLVTS